jgi:hypothetical protein
MPPVPPERLKRRLSSDGYQGTEVANIYPSSDYANASDQTADTGAAGATSILSSSLPIETPSDTDILLGRGRPVQEFPGNQWMLRIVSEFREKYTSARRDRRRSIAEELLDTLYKKGARFLKREDVGEDSSWVTVGRDAAYEKVTHALRSKNRIMKEKRDIEITASMSGPTVDAEASSLRSTIHLPIVYPPSLSALGVEPTMLLAQINLLLAPYTVPGIIGLQSADLLPQAVLSVPTTSALADPLAYYRLAGAAQAINRLLPSVQQDELLFWRGNNLGSPPF